MASDYTSDSYTDDRSYQQKSEKTLRSKQSSKLTTDKSGSWRVTGGGTETNSQSDKDSLLAIPKSKRSRQTPVDSRSSSLKGHIPTSTRYPGWHAVGRNVDTPLHQPSHGDGQARKFSNRYLVETNNCGRYDLIEDYFKDMSTLGDTMKTPVNLITVKHPKPPIPQKRTTLVRNTVVLKRAEQMEAEILRKAARDNETAKTICNKDGTPWQYKHTANRSEVPWFRKHFNSNEPIVPPRKRIHLEKVQKPGRHAPCTREINSFSLVTPAR